MRELKKGDLVDMDGERYFIHEVFLNAVTQQYMYKIRNLKNGEHHPDWISRDKLELISL